MTALKNRLAKIEERLRANRGTRDSTPPVRPEPTPEYIVEVLLNFLAYSYEGDTEAFAQGLVERFGYTPPERAKELAEVIGRILEERQAAAWDPRRPV